MKQNGTKDLTVKQVSLWVGQELRKIDTAEKARARITSIENSMNGFWKSPAGIKAGLDYPRARQAQLDLYRELQKRF